jgi:hypothetical protein
MGILFVIAEIIGVALFLLASLTIIAVVACIVLSNDKDE